MYTITLNDLPFYDLRVQDLVIKNPSLRMEANLLATLTFTVYPNNPRFNDIAIRNTVIRVYSDNELLIVMRPIRITETLKGGLTVYCEEMLGALADIVYDDYNEFGVVNDLLSRCEYILNQASIDLRDGQNPYGVNVVPSVTRAFDSNLADENKKFVIDELGNVLDMLRAQTCDKFTDGFLYAQYNEDKMTVCFHIQSELPVSQQTIEFGKNLQDFSSESNGDEFFTRLIPLGADKSTTSAERHAGAANTRPLTVSGQAVPTRDGGTSNYITFIADPAELTVGVKAKVVRFEEIKSAATLLSRGLAYFNANKLQATKIVNLKAVDRHFVDASIPALKFLTRVPVIVPHMGVNQEYLIKRMNIILDSPDGSTAELGEVQKSLTDLSAQNTKVATNRITALNNRVFGLENPES